MHKNSVNNIFITSCPAARRAYTGLSGAKQQLLPRSCASHTAGDHCLRSGGTSPVISAGLCHPSAQRDTAAQVTALSRGRNSREQVCQSRAAMSPNQGRATLRRQHCEGSCAHCQRAFASIAMSSAPVGRRGFGDEVLPYKQTHRVRVRQ